MVEASKQILMSAYMANGYTVSQPSRTLGYAKNLFIVENRGGGSGVAYLIDATPDLENGSAPWINIHSGTVLSSGDTKVHRLEYPWDAVRIQGKNLGTNMSAAVTVWCNRDPR